MNDEDHQTTISHDSCNVQSWQDYYQQKKVRLEYPDENLVRLLHLQKKVESPQSVLDFGCGGGRHLSLLPASSRIFALDSSSSALQQSKERCPQAMTILSVPPKKDAHLCQNTHKPTYMINQYSELLNIIGAGSLDLAIIWGVLHYIPRQEREEILTVIVDLLKNKGKLCATVRSKSDNHLQQQPDLKAIQYDLFSKAQASAFFAKYFSRVDIGYQERRPVGDVSRRICHWIVYASK